MNVTPPGKQCVLLISVSCVCERHNNAFICQKDMFKYNAIMSGEFGYESVKDYYSGGMPG